MAKIRGKEEEQILNVSLALAREEGWSDVTIDKIAERANIPKSKVLETFPDTKHVVLALMRHVSAEVFQSLEPEDSCEPTRDIILNALMCRVEILSKNREAYTSIFKDLFFNPKDSIFLYSEIMNIMARTLEIAGVSNSGLLGTLRRKALAAIYLSTLRIWIADDSPGFARTMSFLDKRLLEAESMEGFVQNLQRVARVS